jgi:hypothetical protein
MSTSVSANFTRTRPRFNSCVLKNMRGNVKFCKLNRFVLVDCLIEHMLHCVSDEFNAQ